MFYMLCFFDLAHIEKEMHTLILCRVKATQRKVPNRIKFILLGFAIWMMLVSNSPNVRHQRHNKDKQLTEMNEWKRANGHSSHLICSPSHWMKVWFIRSVRWTQWGMILSPYGEVDCWDPPPPPPRQPSLITGVAQLNHQGLLTHGLSAAQYAISLCCWPAWGNLTVYCPLWKMQ